MAKIGFVSLGCAKNLVDTEVMLGLLAREGHEITSTRSEAEIIVVNTCGFIESAKQESIDSILEMARQKEEGCCRRLVVTGCLVERYRQQILAQIPEVDAVLGTSDIPRILEACREGPLAEPIWEPREAYLYSEHDPRILTTPAYTAYLKISEGCDHPCSFCVIPRMRGTFRSRAPESILAEASGLARQGVREINLVAQDSTMYGRDRGERHGLARLLRALAEIPDLEWIRVLYAYPNTVTDEFLEAVASSEQVCRYIDMPLQHASAPVLKRMRRGGSRAALSRLIRRIRERIPGVALRTTMIVGFPGETEADFRELVEFTREAAFDRLGVFAYSDEEEAASHTLDGKVPEAVKKERRECLMEVQSGISLKKNRRLVGRVLPLLVEGPSAQSDLLWQGRLESQAPGIDGVVYLNDGVDEHTRPGEIRRVRLTEAHPYDLVGTLLP